MSACDRQPGSHDTTSADANTLPEKMPCAASGTYQHAIVAVFVKKQHPGFRRHSNLILWDLPSAGVEDRLTANAAICGRREIQKQCPCRLAWNLLPGL